MIVLAFSLRLGWLLIAEPIPVSDFAQYQHNAFDLLDHGQYGYPEPTAYRLPLLPLLLAGSAIVSRSAFWLSLTTVTLSTVIVLQISGVVFRLGGSRTAARAAMIIAAVIPQFVLFAPVLASEHLLGVLVLWGLLAATHPRRSLTGRIVRVGLLSGAATLTRGDGALYGVVLYVIAVMHEARQGLGAMPKARVWVRQGAVFALLFALTVSPWIIRNELIVERGTLLGGNAGQVFYYGHNPIRYGYIPLSETPMAGLSERETQREAWRLGLDYVVENPTSIVTSALLGSSELLSPGLQTYGIYWSTRNERWFTDDPDRTATRPDLKSLFDPLRGLSILGAWFLTITAPLALFAGWTRLLKLVTIFVAANWVFYALIFLGNPRFRYMVDVFLIMAAGRTISVLLKERRRNAGSSTDAPQDGSPQGVAS